MRDQILGCILGGAIGDAFGSAYEGRQPPVVISEAVEWRLSDDTQLTLATCEAISTATVRLIRRRLRITSPDGIALRASAEWARAHSRP